MALAIVTSELTKPQDFGQVPSCLGTIISIASREVWLRQLALDLWQEGDGHMAVLEEDPVTLALGGFDLRSSARLGGGDRETAQQDIDRRGGA